MIKFKQVRIVYFANFKQARINDCFSSFEQVNITNNLNKPVLMERVKMVFVNYKQAKLYGYFSIIAIMMIMNIIIIMTTIDNYSNHNNKK